MRYQQVFILNQTKSFLMNCSCITRLLLLVSMIVISAPSFSQRENVRKQKMDSSLVHKWAVVVSSEEELKAADKKTTSHRCLSGRTTKHNRIFQQWNSCNRNEKRKLENYRRQRRNRNCCRRQIIFLSCKQIAE